LLLLPILAAELVLAATPDATGAFGPFVGPQVVVSVGESSDPDGRDAKRGRSPAKPDPFGAKLSSRGRALPPDAVERLENDDEAFEAARSTRGSMYVCPSDMVMIGRSYCIDVYEASLLQATADGSEKPWPYYQVLPAGVVVRAVSVPGVYPQGYVSGLQARAACERSGKRLCAPGEWKNACMGPKKTIFPYGNARQTGRCNDNGRSAMRALNPALDGKPEHRWMWGHAGNMIDPRLNQLEGTLTHTGERASCTNEYGVFDMVGNLHEWVDDPDGTFQGGYYLDTHLNGDGCYYRTTAHPMSHYDYSTGFRCCADVAAP
jgi:formylglycine-generating enzyme